MSKPDLGPCPPRFVEIKKDIASSYPDFQERVTKAWNELLAELDTVTSEIAAQGSDYVPQVNFSELANLSSERIEEIRRKGSLVIKDVVDDEEATQWRQWLREYVTKNPSIDGFPAEDKQFFQLYWTRSQVRARAHPNVLAATSWLNNMYHVRSGAQIENVDLSTPLMYADRFRIRHPGVQWDAHPPHVDGGGIERWEDPTFRHCFEDILSGNWRQHDPYDLEDRINARSSMYGRVGQATIFRTYQGWLAVSGTAPHEGTLQVFPSVYLSNAYTILRPFFRPKEGAEDVIDSKNWEYDITSSDFPGVYSTGSGFRGPWPNTKTHPHLRLDETMVSVPKVNPGDMVFWHCDVVHAVEKEHIGNDDSAVMYIPAVPYTPANADYVVRQKESFLQGIPPPDFPRGHGEIDYAGVGRPEDVEAPIAKKSMGFMIEVA
ncbi:DUF1479-domain-containing protein [Sparassis latifolia]|uniref:DUF1479-domain-containing protein n=1 Tax=Sparassis crispa TaxID=139825 RepID=A0A401H287_9APHY|nr:hypothetical protein SCP_1303610 [Sparassis crispa]GBE88545.1 hypothetical protein SCP_1303610 [Sparassis crispa]